MSVGLFRRVPFEQVHACVQSGYNSGGDAVWTECLWKARTHQPACPLRALLSGHGASYRFSPEDCQMPASCVHACRALLELMLEGLHCVGMRRQAWA